MRWVHKLKVTMLEKPGDVEADIVAAIKDLAGQEPKLDQVEDSDSKIVGAEILKESQQNDILKKIVAGVKEQAKTIVDQADSRVHEEEEEWNFYLRFDKAAYLKERKMILTDSGNCVHVKLTLAVFPKKREPALALVKRLFTQAKKTI